MTDDKRAGKLANDGYSKTHPLLEGLIRKGGTNSSTSQIQTRPPAPPPMRPAADGQASTQSGGKNQ